MPKDVATPEDTTAPEWARQLGDAVNAALTEHDHTRKWLAQRIGVDPSTITRIVHGQLPMTMDQLSRIARVLGVTRRSILSRAGYLEAKGESTLDLDTLPPMAREMVLAAVRAALDSGE